MQDKQFSMGHMEAQWQTINHYYTYVVIVRRERNSTQKPECTTDIDEIRVRAHLCLVCSYFRYDSQESTIARFGRY